MKKVCKIVCQSANFGIEECACLVLLVRMISIDLSERLMKRTPFLIWNFLFSRNDLGRSLSVSPGLWNPTEAFPFRNSRMSRSPTSHRTFTSHFTVNTPQFHPVTHCQVALRALAGCPRFKTDHSYVFKFFTPFNSERSNCSQRTEFTI